MSNDTTKNKPAKRMAKKDRADSKFWADGGRERILNRYVPLMADALPKGWNTVREVVRWARREFDFHVNWRLADVEEPPQPFRYWSPEMAREELTLTTEEETEYAIWSERMTGRVRRWLIYRGNKLVKVYNQSRAVDIDDPYVRLIAKFLKIEKPPKARQAVQEWSHEFYDVHVREVADKEWAAHKVKKGLPGDKGMDITFRGDVTRRLFKELVSAEERVEWKKKAGVASEVAKEEYKAALNAPYAQDAESRQRAINNFTKFITPLLEGCAEIMGLKIMCIAGGPMPRFGGAIRTIGVPVGVNKDAIPSSFAEYNATHYAAVLDVYKHWLETCYDARDVAEARLGDENEVEGEDVQGIMPLLARLQEVHEDMHYKAQDEESDDDEAEDEDDEDNNENDNEEGTKKGKKRGAAGAAEGPRKRRAAAPKVVAVKENSKGARTKGKATPRQKKTAVSPATAQLPIAGAEETTIPNVDSAPLLAMTTDTEMGDASIGTAMMQESMVVTGGDGGGSASDGSGLRLPGSQPFSFSEWEDPDAMDPATWGWMQNFFPTDLGAEGASDLNAFGTDLGGQGRSNMDTFGLSAGSSGFSNADLQNLSSFAGGAPLGGMQLSNGHTAYAEGSQSNGGVSQAPKVVSAPRIETGNGSGQDTERGRNVVPNRSINARGDDVDVSGTADWFRALWRILKSDALGPSYMSLMKAWLALESTHQFDNPRQGLSSTHRPGMVGGWIKRGRKALLGVGEKKLPSVQAFRVEYGSWWEFLQPEWRKRTQAGGWTVKGRNDDWEDLDVKGVNGLVGIVACLRWWGDNIGGMVGDEKEVEMAVWEKAVIDAAWVMDQLRLAQKM